jgi:hypothetical protein
MNFTCQRFGTLCLFNLHRPMKMGQSVPKRWHNKVQAPGNYPEESIKQHNTFYVEILLARRPSPKLEDHSLSAFRDCLFNILTATLHIVGHSSICNLRTRHTVVTETYLSRGTKRPRIFNLGRRWCWMVTFPPWQLYSQRSTPGDNEKGKAIGGWYICPGRFSVYWESKPDARVVQAAVQSLHWLRYHGFALWYLESGRDLTSIYVG